MQIIVPANVLFCTFNRRQNKLRHFVLKGHFDVAFPPSYLPYNVVPLFELPLENNKHPNFEWRGQGRGVDSFVI